MPVSKKSQDELYPDVYRSKLFADMVFDLSDPNIHKDCEVDTDAEGSDYGKISCSLFTSDESNRKY